MPQQKGFKRAAKVLKRKQKKLKQVSSGRTTSAPAETKQAAS